VVSHVEPPLKACGNDGLWHCYQPPLCSIRQRTDQPWLKLRGIDPKEIKFMGIFPFALRLAKHENYLF
jgi:hypothetical protein